MAVIQLLANGTYAVGTRNVGPAVLPSTLRSFMVEIAGAAMLNPAMSVIMTLDFSLDGVTWASESPGPSTNPFPITVKFVGGALDRFGNPVNPSFRSILPSPGLSGRQIRGSLNISGASMTTVITITVN
jgi:hypothetical protein